MTVDLAQGILLQARRIAMAGEHLNQVARQNPHLLAPSFVLSALALELLVKCLYVIETGRRPKMTHDYAGIVTTFQFKTRQELSAGFADALKHRDMTDVEAVEAASSMTVPRDFLPILQEGSAVFVNARYIFEGKPWTFFFYPEVKEVLIRAILTRRPELGPW